MLLVKTKVKESSIHGIGLFADEFIPKDTVIFKESIFTKKFTDYEYRLLPELQREFINHYCYFLGGIWRCSLDNDRFMNHSQTPNTIELDELTTIASKDICIDEEITTDYDTIHFQPIGK
jgi:SET domain-containing protein